MYQLVLFPSIGGYTMHYRFFLEKHVKLVIRPRRPDLEGKPTEDNDEIGYVSIELWWADEKSFDIKLDIPVGWSYCISRGRRPTLKQAVRVSKQEASHRECEYETWFGFYPPESKKKGNDDKEETLQEELLVQISELAPPSNGTKVWVVDDIPQSWEAVKDTKTISVTPSRCN